MRYLKSKVPPSKKEPSGETATFSLTAPSLGHCFSFSKTRTTLLCGPLIQFLKEHFSRHGIPVCMVTDNGSQIISQEFREWTKAGELTHVTSSPRYPKSNGKAESAVKIVKDLMKKGLKDSRDPRLALLVYRNTPTKGYDSSPAQRKTAALSNERQQPYPTKDSSPAQRKMSRRTSTLLPTSCSLLNTKVVDGGSETIMQKKQKAKYFNDSTATALPEIEIGQEVRIVPVEKNQPWMSEKCVQQLSDLSYLVETPKDKLC